MPTGSSLANFVGVLDLAPDVGRRDDLLPDVEQRGRERLVEVELHRERVDRGDGLDVVEAAADLALQVEREHDVVGGERLAVRPLHALAQLVGDAHAVGSHFPFRRQPRGRGAVCRVVDEHRFVDRLLRHRELGVRERVEVAVERSHVFARNGEQLAAVQRVGGGASAAAAARERERRRRRECGRDEHRFPVNCHDEVCSFLLR